jgi:hypothetical protein
MSYGTFLSVNVTVRNQSSQQINGRLVKIFYEYMSPFSNIPVRLQSDFTQALSVYGVPVTPSPGLITLGPNGNLQVSFITNIQIPSDVQGVAWLMDAVTGNQTGGVNA